MAYMKWVHTIKEAARIQMEQGMLGVLAAKSGVPEGRLRDWLEKKTIDDPNHGELTALHAALCPPEESNVITETERQRDEELAKHAGTGRRYTRADHISAFDESD